jgi:hypothetical protein
MMKIIITGGGGYLAGRLREHPATQGGYELTLINRSQRADRDMLIADLAAWTPGSTDSFRMHRRWCIWPNPVPAATAGRTCRATTSRRTQRVQGNGHGARLDAWSLPAPASHGDVAGISTAILPYV